jgi:hypothetical protein
VRDNKRSEDHWEIYDKRYQPEPTLLGHLTFALRHESIDLLILKRVLDKASQPALVEIVHEVELAESIVTDAFQNSIV